MGKINSYRDLVVWQRSLNIAVSIYQVTETFPSSEVYGLTSQIRRSAVSIPSNIAEGHSRSSRDYARFVRMAKGSLSELETQIEIAFRVSYLPEDDFLTLTEELVILGRQLNSLLTRLKAK